MSGPVVAVVPARGGSVGIPRKNLALVGGRSLLRRAIEAAQSADVDRVVVSTDDQEIASEARKCGAEVLIRPPELATDDASSESALAHALGAIGVSSGVLVMIQCTSPFVSGPMVYECIDKVRSGGFDCAFTAAPTHSFLWRVEKGLAEGVNHDESRRLRRQELPGEFIETGAVYAMETARFLMVGHRFFGRVGLVEVGTETALEVDEPSDLALARLMASSSEVVADSRLSNIGAIAFDFDGVFTDNRVSISEDGTESVYCSRADGMGISLLQDQGIHLTVISKERNEVVARRCEKLGLAYTQAVDEKVEVFDNWLASIGVEREHAAFVGNDINDLGCIAAAGLGVAVADCHHEVAAEADLVLANCGGFGAVREFAERVLTAKGDRGDY